MNFINTLKNKHIIRKNFPAMSSIVAGVLVGICLLGIIMPRTINADSESHYQALVKAEKANLQKAIKKIQVVITAYSSTPEETDDTPFITASGKHVAEDIIANNILPFGTKVRIPALYGDKVFTVGDRMNKRMGNHRFDIWFPSKDLAINFGVKKTEIEVLED